jgi:hypothetical protein
MESIPAKKKNRNKISEMEKNKFIIEAIFKGAFIYIIYSKIFE